MSGNFSDCSIIICIELIMSFYVDVNVLRLSRLRCAAARPSFNYFFKTNAPPWSHMHPS